MTTIRHRILTEHEDWNMWHPNYGLLGDVCNPYYFLEYLTDKLEKFKRQYNENFVIYTIAEDMDTGTMSIAVKHPKDKFSVEVAEQVVCGRIARMDGHIRTPYNPIPKYVRAVRTPYNPIVRVG